MKFPIIVLSYGEFSKTNRLFIYENNGVPVMPIFYDPELALNFIKYMINRLIELGDDRKLHPQICSKPSAACDMFKVISSISPELNTIAIDPIIDDGKISELKTIGIDEVIEQIQSCLSKSNTE